MSVGSAVVFLLAISSVASFYVPGVAPVEFRKGDVVDVKVMLSEQVDHYLQYTSLTFFSNCQMGTAEF